LNTEAPLATVCNALDKLAEVGAIFEGLIPSTLSLDGHMLPPKLPPALDGQRDSDRSFPGSNLMHDHPLLKLMYELGAAIGRPDYVEAADRYVRRFATRCTETPSGLFPWGEHAFWDIIDDRPGNGYLLARARRELTHDHLNQAPIWLWEKLWEFNPACVPRFAEGLDWHWIDESRTEYTRHAPLFRLKRYQNYQGKTCDFPRHSGSYILDLAFALARTERADFRQHLCQFLDYWWEKRHATGALAGVSRPSSTQGEEGTLNLAQTLSLTVSLLEAARFLESFGEDGLAGTLGQRGNVYLDGIMAAPHAAEEGLLAVSWCPGSGESQQSGIWGSKYGAGRSCSASQALLLSAAYRLTERPGLQELAASIARVTAQTPFPDDEPVPARDAGVALELLCDLSELTGEDGWLRHLEDLSSRVTDRYLDQLLPRSATGIDWYESQLGTAYLLHGLGRTALLLDGTSDHTITPNYTLR